LSTSDYLPSVIIANDSRISSRGVDTIYLLPSLSIDNVLYVPMYSFNLLFINRFTHSFACVISFTKDSVCLQDWSSRRMIGIGCESHGLYHLQTFAWS